MSPVFEHTDCFIIRDILAVLDQNPDMYALNTLKGLSEFKKLAVAASSQRVKSLRGAFQQAKLTGLCLASGWTNTHQGIDDSDSLLPELILLVGKIDTADYQKINMSGKDYDSAMELSIIRGFESGIRMGHQAAEQFKRKNGSRRSMTTDDLYSFLELHYQPHPQNDAVLVTRHKNRISRQTRQNIKQR